MPLPHLQYVGGDTALHGLRPLTKLLVLVLVTLSVFVFEGWYPTLALAVFVSLLYIAAGIGAAPLLRVLKPLPPFAVLIVLAHLFLIGHEDGALAASLRGLLQGARIATVLLAAGLFLAVTDPVAFSDAVVDVLGPLRRFGVRVDELSLMVMVAMSFMPLMSREASRLRTAQAVRCGFRRGLGVIGEVLPLLVPLVVGVFRRADELEHSMTARYFELGVRRTPSDRAGRLDAAVCLIGLALFIAGLYAKFQADH